MVNVKCPLIKQYVLRKQTQYTILSNILDNFPRYAKFITKKVPILRILPKQMKYSVQRSKRY